MMYNKFLAKIKNSFHSRKYDNLSKQLTKKLVDTNNVDDFFIEDKLGDNYIPIPKEICRKRSKFRAFRGVFTLGLPLIPLGI